MKSNSADKYFEVSAKTGEGIDKLMYSIKYDSLKFLEVANANRNIEIDIKKRIRKRKEKCIIY